MGDLSERPLASLNLLRAYGSDHRYFLVRDTGREVDQPGLTEILPLKGIGLANSGTEQAEGMLHLLREVGWIAG